MSDEMAELSQLNFTGGVPTASDLAPSIVFLVAYIATTPLLFWRIFRSDSRCWDLLRPTLFWAARVGAYGLRAYMSKNQFNASELVAELILLSLGTLFIIEPLVGLWKRHCQSSVALEEQGGLLLRISALLRAAVLAAIALSIVASADISSASNNPSEMSSIHNYRVAAGVIQVVVVIVVLIMTIVAHVQFSLDVRKTGYIFIPGLSMAIVTVYRLAQTCTTDMSAPVHKQIVFWICSSTFEFIAYVALIAIKIPVWYPGAAAPVHDDAPMKQVEGQQPYPMQTQMGTPAQMEGGQMRHAAQAPYQYRQ